MSHADALTLRPDQDGSGGIARWALAGAVVIALHGLAFVYVGRAPEPVAFESQVPIEMDLLPPPSGAAQLSDAGADATSESQPEQATDQPVEPEELTELEVSETPPPPDPDTVATEEPEETEAADAPPLTAAEVPPDLAAAPPDIEAAVALPPEATVTAREETVQPPKVEPKPQVARQQPKPRPVTEQPKSEKPRPAPKADRKPEQPSQVDQQAGGRGGASSNAGASRAASAAFRSRVQAAVAAQKPKVTGFSGRATVSFTVSRSGAVTGISASGPPEAAAAASAMVRRASIPAMPADMTERSVLYTIGISFN